MMGSTMRRLLAGVVGAVVLMPVPAFGADAGPSGTANYSCRLGGIPTDVTATLTMSSVPDSVAPGDRLEPRGTLTLSLPTQTALLTKLLSLSSRAGVSSADFRLIATTHASPSDIVAASVRGPEESIGQPFAVDAEAVFDAFVVPRDATGDVELAMPTGQPAFTAVLSPKSLLGQRELICASQDDSTSLIARIPVESAAAPSAGAGLVPDASMPLPATLPPAAADLPADSTGPVDAAARPVYAPIPPHTREHLGVFIPAWALALFALIVPLAAVGYSLLLWTRLRTERAARDRRRATIERAEA